MRSKSVLFLYTRIHTSTYNVRMLYYSELKIIEKPKLKYLYTAFNVLFISREISFPVSKSVMNADKIRAHKINNSNIVGV